MENSPLGKLSAELRNIISEMVLDHDVIKCRLSPRDDGVACRQIGFIYGDPSQYNDHPCALAHTCKQARNECTKLYYARNSFMIDTTAITYQQFCAWFQDFTKTAGQTLGVCVTEQSLDNLDDDAAIATLQEAMLRIPHYSGDGLDLLGAVTFTCRLVGEHEMLVFETEVPLRRISTTLLDLASKAMLAYQQTPGNHGPQCMLRAVRMVHCLAKGAAGLPCEKNSGISDELHEELCEDMANVSAELGNVISLHQQLAERFQVVDEPCKFQGCRPVEQRPTGSDVP